MIRKHALLYFGSRLTAAAANLAAVGLFTRLADPQIYGGTLLIFSWTYVLLGFCGQWIGASFFGLRRPDETARQVVVVVWLMLAAFAAIAAAAAAAAAAGIVDGAFATAVGAATMALLLFVTLCEIERTRLRAGTVAAMYVLRAGLTLALGCPVLLHGGGAAALAFALSLANVAASLPSLLRLGPALRRRPEPAFAREMWRFGWPLVAAFGLAALGQNVDRLVLVHVGGVDQLGAYGATYDFLKQSFGVVCEAITLAYTSVAKDARQRGHHAESKAVLEDTFRAVVATVAFGAVLMVTFSGAISAVIFGPGFRAEAEDVIPWLIVANGALVLRAFYFGQAIYFGQTSRNEAAASLAIIAATAALAYGLVPRFGAHGAACAATGGQLAGCLVFAAARPRMPVPTASAGGIVLLALAALGVELAIGRSHLLAPGPEAAAQLVVLAASGAAALWIHDILGARSALAAIARHRLPAGQR